MCRSELCGVKESLEREETTKAATVKELQSLQEQHNNEMLAVEHARGLAKLVNALEFINASIYVLLV